MAALARKGSVAGPTVAPKKTQIELDKMKYDLFNGVPKQSIVAMTNANGGEVYEGQVDTKNRRHGKGTLRWPNGNIYFGQWHESSMCGNGIFLYAVENDTYRGEFKDDKKHGAGRYDFSNGNFYEGSFAVDKRHGRGRYSWTCGDSYEGEWQEGHMQGRGTTIYSNGNRYDGEFVADRREGKGKLTCADGLSYDGSWLKNMRHGVGRLQFQNGDYYEGEWDNDKKHGNGTDSFINGNKFVGQYRDNVKHGHGVMTYANGDKYTGDWKTDKMDGQGIYEFSNGFVYEGAWAADVRHGMGRYTFPTGHVYVGEWRSDKRHGTGQLTIAPSGDVYKGTWMEGKMHGRFVVERRSDFVEGNSSSSPSSGGGAVAFQGPLRKVYEGHWELGVPTKGGTYFIYPNAQATQPLFTIDGDWDTSQATRKSDGTIDFPSVDHWRAVGLLTQLSTLGKKTNHLLSSMDHVFDGMSNRPLMDYYDAELLSYMPSASAAQERLGRLKKYAAILPALEKATNEMKKNWAVCGGAGDSSGGNESDAANSLRQSITDAEMQAAERRQRVEALDHDVVRAVEETSQLTEDAKQFKIKIDRSAKQRDEIKSYKSSISKLEAQCSDAEKEIAALRAALASQEDDIPATQAEVTRLQALVEATVSTERALKESALQDAKRDLLEKEAALKAATKKVNDASAKAREQKATTDSQIQKLQAQIAVATKALTDLEKSRAQKQKKHHDDLKRRGDQEASLLQQTSAELARLQKLLATTEGSHSEAQQRLDEARAAASALSDVGSLEEEVKRTRERNAACTRELHDADATIQRLQDELVTLRRAEIDEVKQAEEAATARREREQGAAEAKVRQQRTGLEILEADVQSLDEQLAPLRKRRAELSSELELLAASAAAAAAAASSMVPVSPKPQREESSTTTSSSPKKRKSSQFAVFDEDPAPPPQAQPSVAGRLRRGSSAVLQQAREDAMYETTSGGGVSDRANSANSVAQELAEYEKRLAVLQRQNDADEIAIEKLLREKGALEQQIKELNDALTNKAVTHAAAMFASNSVNVSLDLNEAGKEAVRHQLIKARGKQSSLLKEQDRLRLQLGAAEDAVADIQRQNAEGSQQSIAAIIASLRPEDWRLAYLVEQLETKAKQIVELEAQCSKIPLMEDQLQSLKETLTSLQSKQQQVPGSVASSSRRPAPF